MQQKLQDPEIRKQWFNVPNFLFFNGILTAFFLILAFAVDDRWRFSFLSGQIEPTMNGVFGCAIFSICFFIFYGNGYCYFLTRRKEKLTEGRNNLSD